jgi:RNA polymerase sigma factor (sigma-70 family)
MRTGLPFDDVLAAAQAGAAWAFEVLYRDLAPTVTGYLRLHVLTGLAGFRGDEDALRAWVFTIAHRRLVDDWRRRGRRPQVTDDDALLAELGGGDAEDDALVRIGAADVHRLCGTLPGDQRTVLLLRILGDLTVDQVAQVLGRSVGSVKALQRRGLRSLRTALETVPPERVRTPAHPSVALRR